MTNVYSCCSSKCMRKLIRLMVRCNNPGRVTKEIPVRRGDRLDCVLVPGLFNYYVNSLILHLSRPTFHPPKLAQRHISLLLYANEAIILLLTFIGLKRALRSFMHHCTEEELIINYAKTKILTFSKRPK